jgi:sugar phosphate isomerase/epimerase
LILYTGSRNRHIPSHAKRCVTQAIDNLLPIAQEFGVRLLLQPMLESISRRWNFIHDWGSLFQIIDRYPPESVGFVLNTYHASFLGEVWDLLPDRIGQLGLVQISDSVDLPSGSKHRDDCLLGQGSLVPDHRLKQIVDLGYRGWVEVEVLGPTWGRDGYRHVLEASQQFATELFATLTPDGPANPLKQDVV